MMATPVSTPLRGELRRNEPMSRHSSWRVGGPADCFYVPADLADLIAFLRDQPEDEPLIWLGLGSNVLIRDGGIRGTVIALSGALNELSMVKPGVIRAETGVADAKVARYSVAQGLTGAEFLAGIPGTVGGALAMNAGAFGYETWSIVQAVETIDRHGEVRVRPPSDYRIAYRSISGPEEEWFVAAHFALTSGEQSESKTQIKNLLAKRGATQPTQIPNAGSVFKNPMDDHSARLIEACGLKGECIGKACVSTLHANFIVNTGGATAADIERLIARVQSEVQKKHGVKLETEVRVIGETV
jgi:UDP-N-acetylmuramate dehydrogenase